MNTKHIFVSTLDINGQLPFLIKKTKKLQESFQEQDRAKKELLNFIKKLEKNFKEDISYLGMDVIGEKSYERFMFKSSGFLEFMVEEPVAITAHFPSKPRAKKFLEAFKKTMKTTLKNDPQKDLFIDSIELSNEEDQSLTVGDWNKIKNIKI
jgi:hypothetical protein